MKIVVDDARSPEVHAFLEAHRQDMLSATPPESVHAPDPEALRAPNVVFWTVWDADEVVGCAALREFTPGESEVKAMRVAPEARGRGVGAMLMEAILGEARRRGHQRMWLETGPEDFFEPARRLYTRFGFKPSGPFSTYPPDDPHLYFMSCDLSEDGQ